MIKTRPTYRGYGQNKNNAKQMFKIQLGEIGRVDFFCALVVFVIIDMKFHLLVVLRFSMVNSSGILKAV